MGYTRRYGMGDETVDPAPDGATMIAQLDKIDRNTAEVIERLKVEKRARKIGTYITIAGAVFAAIRLGIVAVPKFLRRGAGELGHLGEEALSPAHARPNPRRRRR